MGSLLTIEYYVLGIYICSVTGLVITLLTLLDSSTKSWRNLINHLWEDTKTLGQHRGISRYE